MSNIETLINKKLQKNPDLEVFAIDYEGQRLWVKRARKTGSILLQHIVYMFTQNPIIIPVTKKSPQEALEFESSKLQVLYDLSISVPKVVYVSKEYFVLEDCGPTVRQLAKSNTLEDMISLYENIITQLAILHNSGNFHGGSQIKNFTYKDEKIYFIDFEESFDKNSDLKELQFRDLCLFLFSISKAKVEVDYKSLLNKYVDLTNNKDVIHEFHQLISKLSFLIKLVKNKTIWNRLGEDGKSIIRLLQELKQIPVQQSTAI